jgi:hypothetical protein
LENGNQIGPEVANAEHNNRTAEDWSKCVIGRGYTSVSHSRTYIHMPAHAYSAHTHASHTHTHTHTHTHVALWVAARRLDGGIPVFGESDEVSFNHACGEEIYSILSVDMGYYNNYYSPYLYVRRYDVTYKDKNGEFQC